MLNDPSMMYPAKVKSRLNCEDRDPMLLSAPMTMSPPKAMPHSPGFNSKQGATSARLFTGSSF